MTRPGLLITAGLLALGAVACSSPQTPAQAVHATSSPAIAEATALGRDICALHKLGWSTARLDRFARVEVVGHAESEAQALVSASLVGC